MRILLAPLMMRFDGWRQVTPLLSAPLPDAAWFGAAQSDGCVAKVVDVRRELATVCPTKLK
jgi:hypothetical protein